VKFSELCKICKEFDEEHGFPVVFEKENEKFNQITKDLVGLFGEIGEFSNIVKKINIKIEKGDQYELNTPEAAAHLKEELSDSLIYLIRLANILDINLEKECLNKMEKNRIRYENLKKQ
jgi:NTP pyrophosphatase (non-canonical NTP hydrolase)